MDALLDQRLWRRTLGARLFGATISPCAPQGDFLVKFAFHYQFSDVNANESTLTLTLLGQETRIFQQANMKAVGEISLVFDSLDQINVTEKWFTCHLPTKKGVKKRELEDLDVRVGVRYEELLVLPTERYQPLLQVRFSHLSKYALS